MQPPLPNYAAAQNSFLRLRRSQQNFTAGASTAFPTRTELQPVGCRNIACTATASICHLARDRKQPKSAMAMTRGGDRLRHSTLGSRPTAHQTAPHGTPPASFGATLVGDESNWFGCGLAGAVGGAAGIRRQRRHRRRRQSKAARDIDKKADYTDNADTSAAHCFPELDPLVLKYASVGAPAWVDPMLEELAASLATCRPMGALAPATS